MAYILTLKCHEKVCQLRQLVVSLGQFTADQFYTWKV
jgi:hypothetical protein